jgi:hypothetical protein
MTLGAGRLREQALTDLRRAALQAGFEVGFEVFDGPDFDERPTRNEVEADLRAMRRSFQRIPPLQNATNDATKGNL